MADGTTTAGSGIAFEGVSFAYAMDGSRRSALRDVTLTLSPGELLVVVGANGSGKSTLARLCNGLLRPVTGSIVVDGLDTRRHEVHELADDVDPGDLEVVAALAVGQRVVEVAGLGVDEVRGERPRIAAEQRVRQRHVAPEEADDV